MNKKTLVVTVVASLVLFIVQSFGSWLLSKPQIDTIQTSSCGVCMDIRAVNVISRKVGIFGYYEYTRPDISSADQLEDVPLTRSSTLYSPNLALEMLLSISVGSLMILILRKLRKS